MLVVPLVLLLIRIFYTYILLVLLIRTVNNYNIIDRYQRLEN
jgi:hypothetical protein